MEEFILIHENTFEKARNKINENKEKATIFSSDDDELNRKIIEKLPIKILLLNQAQRKDKHKQRDSGLNQVLAKIAKKSAVIAVKIIPTEYGDKLGTSKGKIKTPMPRTRVEFTTTEPMASPRIMSL